MNRILALAILAVFSAPAMAAKDDDVFGESNRGQLRRGPDGTARAAKGTVGRCKILRQDARGRSPESAGRRARRSGETKNRGPQRSQQEAAVRLRQAEQALGADFDKEFADHMVKDHKKDIKEYEKETKQPGPAAEYANAQLPALRNHLEIAQKLKDQLGR